MTNTRRGTMLWLGALALFGLSFWAGRVGACGKGCADAKKFTDCIYSGSTGQILAPTSTCYLWLWSTPGVGSGSCVGSQTCGMNTCVGGSKSYCQAPAAGEYSVLDVGSGGSCGSCSGSTTLSGCQTCM